MSSVGIDIGTTSICAVVIDHKSDEFFTINKPNYSDLKSPYPWEKVQDVSSVVSIVQELLDEVFRRFDDIGEIGITGQMHGILYINSNGDAISPLYTWQDGRGNLPFKDDCSYASFLSELTGYKVASGYGMMTHYYNMKNGLVPEGAVGICTIMDYIAMILTGNHQPMIDPSNAASLGLFDNKKLSFDMRACQRAGIDTSFLPIVVDSQTVIGKYLGKVPVIAAIGDNQASFIGSVRDFAESIHITVGTSSQISVYTPDYLPAQGVDVRPLPGGGYIVVGAALCGGSTLALLKELFMDVVRKITGKTINESVVYDYMSSLKPDAFTYEDLEVVTSFNGTRENPDERGTIGNISPNNFTADNLVIAFMRGLCRELLAFYNQFPRGVREGKKRIVGAGNGIRKNGSLQLVLSDIFNLRLEVSSYQEDAALGASINAMVGNNKIKTYSEFWIE